MFSTVAMQLHIIMLILNMHEVQFIIQMSCFDLGMSDFLSSSEKDGSRTILLRLVVSVCSSVCVYVSKMETEAACACSWMLFITKVSCGIVL